MIESTGYVIEPYKKYPNLFELLLNFLKTEQSSTIRREVSTLQDYLFKYVFNSLYFTFVICV